jgi:hypothetical protein
MGQCRVVVLVGVPIASMLEFGHRAGDAADMVV